MSRQPNIMSSFTFPDYGRYGRSNGFGIVDQPCPDMIEDVCEAKIKFDPCIYYSHLIIDNPDFKILLENRLDIIRCGSLSNCKVFAVHVTGVCEGNGFRSYPIFRLAIIAEDRSENVLGKYQITDDTTIHVFGKELPVPGGPNFMREEGHD